MALSDEPTLRVTGIGHAFGQRQVLAEVTMAVAPGEVVGLLGPNGAGKSTLLHIMMGLIAPQRGRVWLAQRDITGLALHGRARLGIGFLPQDAGSFDELSVGDNVLALLECGSGARAARGAAVAGILARVGLANRVQQVYGTLSGGQRRRVEIAKALVQEPRWLLLDEPFAGLDPQGIADLCGLLRGLAAAGMAVLVADHRHESVLRLADRIGILAEGRIVVDGAPDQVRRHPAARAAYFADGAGEQPA